MSSAVLARNTMVAALVLLLASQVAFMAELVRIGRHGFDMDTGFLLWLGARMAVVAVLAIWLAVGAVWAYWATVTAAIVWTAYLVTAGQDRPLPYALVVVVLAAAVVARPAFRLRGASADADPAQEP